MKDLLEIKDAIRKSKIEHLALFSAFFTDDDGIFWADLLKAKPNLKSFIIGIFQRVC